MRHMVINTSFLPSSCGMTCMCQWTYHQHQQSRMVLHTTASQPLKFCFLQAISATWHSDLSNRDGSQQRGAVHAACGDIPRKVNAASDECVSHACCIFHTTHTGCMETWQVTKNYTDHACPTTIIPLSIYQLDTVIYSVHVRVSICKLLHRMESLKADLRLQVSRESPDTLCVSYIHAQT